MSLEEPTFGEDEFWHAAEVQALTDEVNELRADRDREREINDALADDPDELAALRISMELRDLRTLRRTSHPTLRDLLQEVDLWAVLGDGIYRHSKKRDAMDAKGSRWHERLQSEVIDRAEWNEFSDFNTTRNCQAEQEMLLVGMVIGFRLGRSDSTCLDDWRAAYSQTIEVIDGDPTGWPSDAWDNNDRT